MSGIKDIFGKGTRHLAVVSLLAVLCHGCGTLDKDLPSDKEMIDTFHAKEAAFNEMVELLQDFPLWEGYNPGGYGYREGYWPEDAESRAFFGEERASRIDSLLLEMGCENAHFRYFYSYSDRANPHPVEYSFSYNARGLSIGPSISRSFVYSINPSDSVAITSEIGYRDFRPSSSFMAEGDLDSLYFDIRNKAMENNDRILHILLRRRIADNWIIELQYFD